MIDSGHERRKQILDLIRTCGRVDVASVADELDVSTETVRRDLKLLEARSLVRRHHGGASAIETTDFESSLAMRAGSRVEEKQKIAAAAADFISGSDTVFIDEGYTPYLAAEHLLALPNVPTIVTPSLQIAGMLAAKSHHSVILLGGEVRGRTLGTVEHWALAMLADFNFSVAILGANGISRDSGLTTPDPRVAAVKAAALRSARLKVFVGIHTKFGVTGFCRFGQVSDLDVIVTESALPVREAQLYAALGPKVLRT